MRPDARMSLEHIRDEAQFLLDDTAGETFETFMYNRRLRQSVERSFIVIGEAMRRLRDDDPATAQQIMEYGQVIAFRNILIHVYDDIDHARVWQVIQESLPVLRAEVEQLLSEADSQS